MVILTIATVDVSVSLMILGLMVLLDPAIAQEILAGKVENNGWLLGISTVVSSTVSTVLLGLLAKLRRGWSIQEYLSLRWVGIVEFLKWNLAMVGFILLFDGLSRFFNQSSDFLTEVLQPPQALPLLYVAVAIAAPISEELLFRGFMFRGIQDSRLGRSGAVLIPAFLWAIIHLQYNLYFIGVIFCMGILLGIARWRTHSIYIPISMHALNNLIAMLSTQG